MALAAVVAFAPAGAQTQADSRDGADPVDIRVVGLLDPEGLLPDQTVPKSESAIAAAFITK
ncbi:MAG: hypothetical protein EOP67_16245, partial [Sphingomonas sp.]